MALPYSPYELSIQPDDLKIENVLGNERYYSPLIDRSDGRDEDMLADGILADSANTTDSYLRVFLFNMYADEREGHRALKAAIDIGILLGRELRDRKDPYRFINSYMIAFAYHTYPELDNPDITTDKEDEILCRQIETLKRMRFIKERTRPSVREPERSAFSRDRYADPRDVNRGTGRSERMNARQVPNNYNPREQRDEGRRTTPGARQNTSSRESVPARGAPSRNQEVEQATQGQVGVAKWVPVKEQPYMTVVGEPGGFSYLLVKSDGIVIQKCSTVLDYEKLPDTEKTEDSEKAFMDRSKHIVVRGGCVGTPFEAEDRFRTIESATTGLNEVKSFHLSDPSGSIEANPNVFKQVDHQVGSYETDDAIYQELAAKILQGKLADKRNKPLAVRAFYTHIEPVIGETDNSAFIKKLASSSSYEQIGKTLYMFATEVSHKHKNRSSSDNGTDDSLCLAERVDTIMLKRLSGIINTQLQFNVVPAGNFIANNSEVARYMTSVTGDSVLADAYTKAQILEANSLFRSVSGDAEEIDEHRKLISDRYSIPLENIAVISTPKSITVLPFTYAELGLDLKTGQVKLVDKKITPYLWNIASSLFEQFNALPVRPVDNYVYTSDRVRMCLYETLLSKDGFLISL